MKSIQIEGARLAVSDEGQGPPLLLVHGFPLDHSMWTSQSKVLGGRFRVIAPDLRGLGKSPSKEAIVTMERFADDLEQLLAQLDIGGPITLCGLSMGGYIAFQFIKKYPERVGKLILCDTRAIADAPEAAAGRKSLAEKVMKEGSAPAWDAMSQKLFAKETAVRRPDVLDAVRKMILNNSPAGIAAAALGMAVRPDMTGFLEKISVPTLVLVGEEDAISSVDEMRSIASAIPHSQFVVVPAAGHMSPMENPDFVNDALIRFLSAS